MNLLSNRMVMRKPMTQCSPHWYWYVWFKSIYTGKHPVWSYTNEMQSHQHICPVRIFLVTGRDRNLMPRHRYQNKKSPEHIRTLILLMKHKNKNIAECAECTMRGPPVIQTCSSIAKGLWVTQASPKHRLLTSRKFWKIILKTECFCLLIPKLRAGYTPDELWDQEAISVYKLGCEFYCSALTDHWGLDPKLTQPLVSPSR